MDGRVNIRTLLQLLASVYLIAFISWGVKAQGLIGSLAKYVAHALCVQRSHSCERDMLCAEHVRQFEGESPLLNLMEVKG
jgi:hypothetical protein